MSRLVVFGCSLAYGVGLPDCWPNISKPSKFCWPELVAQTMNRELVNKSAPGSSNKGIWYTISKFKFESDDVVIISWSYPNRYSIINNPWDIRNLHNNLTEDTASMAFYEHLYSYYDTIVMSKLYADDANKILIEKNIPVYNLTVEKHYRYLTLGQHNTVPLYMGEYEESYPKALDKDHLGLDGHKVFAADFMNYIGVKHTLTDLLKPYSIFKQLKNIICK